MVFDLESKLNLEQELRRETDETLTNPELTCVNDRNLRIGKR